MELQLYVHGEQWRNVQPRPDSGYVYINEMPGGAVHRTLEENDEIDNDRRYQQAQR